MLIETRYGPFFSRYYPKHKWNPFIFRPGKWFCKTCGLNSEDFLCNVIWAPNEVLNFKAPYPGLDPRVCIGRALTNKEISHIRIKRNPEKVKSLEYLYQLTTDNIWLKTGVNDDIEGKLLYPMWKEYSDKAYRELMAMGNDLRPGQKA